VQQLHAYEPSLDNPLANAIGSANAPTIQTCELWINNIFVNPEIHDIFIKRIGFSLIRVYRRQIYRVNKANDNILLAQLKWPIETLYIGMRPTANVNTTSTKLLTAWNMYCRVEQNSMELCSVANGYLWENALYSISSPTPALLYSNFKSYTGIRVSFNTLPTDYTWDDLNAYLTGLGYPPINLAAVTTTDPDGTMTVTSPAVKGTDTPTGAAIWLKTNGGMQPQRCVATYDKLLKTVDTIQIEAHGVPLYRVTPVEFFNQYVPYTYGGHHINTPVDVGALMVTFNLYPGSYQPSGHVNVSRAREFYYQYASSWISEANTADMVVVAIAINFLLISDGSAVLRYST
jgi:hypothetical protein